MNNNNNKYIINKYIYLEYIKLQWILLTNRLSLAIKSNQIHFQENLFIHTTIFDNLTIRVRKTKIKYRHMWERQCATRCSNTNSFKFTTLPITARHTIEILIYDWHVTSVFEDYYDLWPRKKSKSTRTSRSLMPPARHKKVRRIR